MKSLQTVGLAVAMHVVLPDADAAGGAGMRELAVILGEICLKKCSENY